MRKRLMRLLRIPACRETSLETAALFSAAGSMGQGNIQLQPAEMGSGKKKPLTTAGLPPRPA